MLNDETQPLPYSGMTVLCVDDETSILRAMNRLFHRKPYNILIAQSGKEALEILKEETIDVVISDMRMPEMDGPTLLTQIATLYPSTYRIVLSGFADFESTVEAINLGQIHKFMNKPWNNNELIGVVEEYLERKILKTENKQLKEKVNEQNKQLILCNRSLQEKVELRTKQIRLALHRNEKNIKASEKVFFNFIAITPHLSGEFAKRVGCLAGKIAEKFGLEQHEIDNIRLAGNLNEIGLLGIDEKIAKTAFNNLNYEQKIEFLDQGKIAQKILSPAQHLNQVKEIIINQYAPLDKIALMANPESRRGCEILNVSRDFWRYTSGRILPKSLDFHHVCIELRKGSDTKYAKHILDILEENPEFVDDGHMEKGLTTLKLLPNMVLKNNLYTREHLLILAEGHEFSDASISRLIEYEKNQQHEFSILVEKAPINKSPITE